MGILSQGSAPFVESMTKPTQAQGVQKTAQKSSEKGKLLRNLIDQTRIC